VPLGSDDVVTVSAGVMATVSDAVADCDALSLTRAVKVLDPALVGVPEMLPPAESDNPAGRVPLASDQVYGDVPPDAASACEYLTPTTPLGRLELVMPNACTVTVMANACTSLPPPLSLTLTVKFAVPEAVGVPLIAPDADRFRLVGNFPADKVQVVGGTAPVEESVAEYGASTTPFGNEEVVITG